MAFPWAILETGQMLTGPLRLFKLQAPLTDEREQGVLIRRALQKKGQSHEMRLLIQTHRKTSACDEQRLKENYNECCVMLRAIAPRHVNVWVNLNCYAL
ncbi:hypothetical protein KDX38_27890 [Pseudomonas sp. CDFA 602]|uniref:hypothetical protein n=1 Tax=Pseudomonas californiensis TaxID=2829823 RepID=UPI001E5DB133|nr:hypothetical protein [Pseudomonas californiensis]MCD5996800.1 hypothetical protein [Pseudomonas californiensis]MCD6002982.1 hypothetical protein [Pseudomonas californiensis]